ncbi:MAG: glutathione S-transferase family protein [Bacteroidota bacterium]
MQYLAERTGDTPLFPKDLKLRANIMRWQCWELAHFNRAFSTLSWETVVKPEYMEMKPNQALVEQATADLERYALVLEGHIKDRHYLTGNELTLADYSLIHLESFKESIPFDWSVYPSINTYYDRMRNIPYWSEIKSLSSEK